MVSLTACLREFIFPHFLFFSLLFFLLSFSRQMSPPSFYGATVVWHGNANRRWMAPERKWRNSYTLATPFINQTYRRRLCFGTITGVYMHATQKNGERGGEGGGKRKEEWIGTDSTEAGKQASKQAIECCQHSVTRRPKVWSWEAPPAVYPMPLF